MPLVITQCSNKKAPGQVAGAFKYDNRTHRAILDFMMDGGYQAGWDWSIMSAGKGLVHPTTTVDDYDLSLQSQVDVAAWVAKFGAQVQAEVESNDSAEAILFTGSKLYLQALRAALPHRRIQHIGEGGRGCGDYFSALKEGFAMYNEDA